MSQLFKKSAKEYLEQQSLNEQQLTNIQHILSESLESSETIAEAFQQDSNEKETQQNRFTSRAKWLWSTGIAAAIALSFLTLISLNQPEYSTNQVMIIDIANEVAKNYIKMKPLEVKTKDLSQLRNYFTELDFSVIHSNQLNKQKNTLLGARYCSIQGITAAQIRYQSSDDHRISLYEVPYEPEIFGLIPDINRHEDPIKVFVRGLEVNLWVENGLLMASAKTIPEPGS